MVKWILVAAALIFGHGRAWGRTIHAPIVYQYRVVGAEGGERVFYYGGDDPSVFARALRDCRVAAAMGREVADARPWIYSDAIPFWNAWIWGVTVDDARNEAYRSAPRHFVKGPATGRGETAGNGPGMAILNPATVGRGEIVITAVTSHR